MRTFRITAVLILGCTLLVSAQERGAERSTERAAVGAALIGGGLGGRGGYRHASTAAEGAARGMADVIRSSGQANLMNSAAAINVEEARSRHIDNRMQATNTYFQMRAVNKQARYGNKQPFDQQQAIRLTKQGLPDRLSAQKLDPLTGKIRWPLGLTMKEMAGDRKKMEELFAARAENGYLDLDQYNEVRASSARMMSVLQEHGRKLSGGYRIDARKFLESLSYEAGHQAS